jgi:hypothetical protein
MSRPSLDGLEPATQRAECEPVERGGEEPPRHPEQPVHDRERPRDDEQEQGDDAAVVAPLDDDNVRSFGRQSSTSRRHAWQRGEAFSTVRWPRSTGESAGGSRPAQGGRAWSPLASCDCYSRPTTQRTTRTTMITPMIPMPPVLFISVSSLVTTRRAVGRSGS